jgi:hypothetical protein
VLHDTSVGIAPVSACAAAALLDVVAAAVMVDVVLVVVFVMVVTLAKARIPDTFVTGEKPLPAFWYGSPKNLGDGCCDPVV